MQKSFNISEELTQKLIEVNSALTIKKTVMNTMAAGTGITNEIGQNLVDEVADLNAQYNALVYEVVKEGKEHGYDPLKYALSFFFTRGVAQWEEPDEENAGEDGKAETK